MPTARKRTRLPPRDSRIGAGRAAALAFGAGVALGRLSGSPPLRTARLLGSSIAGRDAAGWITDFLNAAYYRHHPEDRRIESLRLASAVLTTRWHELGGRRLHAGDVVAFHRAFGRQRFLDRARSRRGVLDADQVLEGAAALLGDWFGDAYADPDRRAWGVAFRTRADRDAYEPERRLRLASLGPATPAVAPIAEQTWHTYAPVAVADAAAVVGALGTAWRPGPTTRASSGGSRRSGRAASPARRSRSRSSRGPPPARRSGSAATSRSRGSSRATTRPGWPATWQTSRPASKPAMAGASRAPCPRAPPSASRST